MAKSPSFPLIIEQLPYISISDLVKEKALKSHTKAFFILPVRINDVVAGTLNCYSHCEDYHSFIEISGLLNGKNFEKVINLEPVRSNLTGKTIQKESFLWYFECPKTGIRCKKLFLHNGIFGSREYFNPVYRRQVLSKYQIAVEKVCELAIKIEQRLKELGSKKIRRSYKGKPTKAFKKQLRQIKEMENRFFTTMDEVSKANSEELIRVDKKANGFTVTKRTRISEQEDWDKGITDWNQFSLEWLEKMAKK